MGDNCDDGDIVVAVFSTGVANIVEMMVGVQGLEPWTR